MKQNTKSSCASFFSHLCKRYRSRTPKFFKKLIYFMCSLTVLGVGLIGYTDSLPEFMKPVGGYCIAIGAVGSFLSKLTTTDSSLQEVEKEG